MSPSPRSFEFGRLTIVLTFALAVGTACGGGNTPEPSPNDAHSERDGGGADTSPTDGTSSDADTTGGGDDDADTTGGGDDDADTTGGGNDDADTTGGGDDDADAGCTDGESRACGSSEGACEQGTQTCSDGSWSDCQGGTAPQSEMCNGTDDDCDGNTDEDLSRSCGVTTGACQKGTETCQDGQWGTCSGGVQPSPETCDGKDNDCNGKIDDRLSRSCGTNTGTCEQGTEFCSAGSWGSCMMQVAPSKEVCDGKDNDCNGKVDDGLTRSCGTSTGACQTGTETCSAGSWGSCMGNVAPSTETCDGKDNDCDGQVDEQLTRSCGSSTGVCQEGSETCSSGSWGSCMGNVGPSKEVCDYNDNDCDGKTDEWSKVLLSEGFEGTDTLGWREWGPSGPGSVSRLDIDDDATSGTASEGSEYAQASYSTGSCKTVAGIGEDFQANEDVDIIRVDVRVDLGAWGRAALFVEDSSGNRTTLWEVNAGGAGYHTNGWKSLRFNESVQFSRTINNGQTTVEQNKIPVGLGNEEITLIFGNSDDTPSCTNNDHEYTVRVDAIEVVAECF